VSFWLDFRQIFPYSYYISKQQLGNKMVNLTGKDFLVTAPGQNVTIIRARDLRDARRIACQSFGLSRLPKGTIVKVYTESDWN
jgi:hypothetical protein